MRRIIRVSWILVPGKQAYDLKLFKPGEHEEPAPRTSELKRMLTAPLQKLNDR